MCLLSEPAIGSFFFVVSLASTTAATNTVCLCTSVATCPIIIMQKIYFTDVEVPEPVPFIRLNPPLWYKRIGIREPLNKELFGYKLLCELQDIQVGYDEYLDFKKAWFDSVPCCLEDFNLLVENTACSTWTKMGPNGEPFPDYAKYDEDYFAKQLRSNAEKLYQLHVLHGFSVKFILETIRHGCSNRMECVAYSAMLCEWMHQVIQQDPSGRL